MAPVPPRGQQDVPFSEAKTAAQPREGTPPGWGGGPGASRQPAPLLHGLRCSGGPTCWLLCGKDRQCSASSPQGGPVCFRQISGFALRHSAAPDLPYFSRRDGSRARSSPCPPLMPFLSFPVSWGLTANQRGASRCQYYEMVCARLHYKGVG